MKKTTRLILLLAALLLVVGISSSAHTVAATSTGAPGQPNQSCQSVFPDGTFNPPGFNTAGFTHAATVYAGSGENLETPANSHAVSQYDVACFQHSN